MKTALRISVGKEETSPVSGGGRSKISVLGLNKANATTDSVSAKT